VNLIGAEFKFEFDVLVARNFSLLVTVARISLWQGCMLSSIKLLCFENISIHCEPIARLRIRTGDFFGIPGLGARKAIGLLLLV
jgi:hypothetical protein